ncbi:MAG: hypothetical protein P0Y55_08510 [Candidatus Cohnella colombiensis]|uniref:Uncharacterized protein n=1 Tax=Candidatus Cohnella colombiensis TaxID=3121368 RepID=A0AA95F055_9BACL|nr:MAG: hypothetical protein P0Y55_08510 [Cohnella sp.]
MKEQIESKLCESLKGRVKFNSTRYRGSHDEVGRSWVTFDNEIIHDFCTVKLRYKYNTTANMLREETNSLDWRAPEQKKGYYEACRIAGKEMEFQGIHNQFEFYKAIEEYLNLSIDEAMRSTNPIIRSISWFDKRLGKRRLIRIEEESNIIVIKFRNFRLEAEGLIDE